jgi:hypothetical protein
MALIKTSVCLVQYRLCPINRAAGGVTFPPTRHTFKELVHAGALEVLVVVLQAAYEIGLASVSGRCGRHGRRAVVLGLALRMWESDVGLFSCVSSTPPFPLFAHGPTMLQDIA